MTVEEAARALLDWDQNDQPTGIQATLRRVSPSLADAWASYRELLATALAHPARRDEVPVGLREAWNGWCSAVGFRADDDIDERFPAINRDTRKLLRAVRALASAPSAGRDVTEGPRLPPAHPARVELWDAINRVVGASGGNSGNTSVARQRAVVEVERAVERIARLTSGSRVRGEGDDITAVQLERAVDRIAALESAAAADKARIAELEAEREEHTDALEEIAGLCNAEGDGSEVVGYVRAVLTADSKEIATLKARIAELEGQLTEARRGFLADGFCVVSQESIARQLREREELEKRNAGLIESCKATERNRRALDLKCCGLFAAKEAAESALAGVKKALDWFDARDSDGHSASRSVADALAALAYVENAVKSAPPSPRPPLTAEIAAVCEAVDGWRKRRTGNDDEQLCGVLPSDRPVIRAALALADAATDSDSSGGVAAPAWDGHEAPARNRQPVEPPSDPAIGTTRREPPESARTDASTGAVTLFACSFCGEERRAHTVVGPGVNICGTCAHTAVQVVEEQREAERVRKIVAEMREPSRSDDVNDDVREGIADAMQTKEGDAHAPDHDRPPQVAGAADSTSAEAPTDPRPRCIDCGARWTPGPGIDATRWACPTCRTIAARVTEQLGEVRPFPAVADAVVERLADAIDAVLGETDETDDARMLLMALGHELRGRPAKGTT